jgi:hypothetical protein
MVDVFWSLLGTETQGVRVVTVVTPPALRWSVELPATSRPCEQPHPWKEHLEVS